MKTAQEIKESNIKVIEGMINMLKEKPDMEKEYVRSICKIIIEKAINIESLS